MGVGEAFKAVLECIWHGAHTAAYFYKKCIAAYMGFSYMHTSCIYAIYVYGVVQPYTSPYGRAALVCFLKDEDKGSGLHFFRRRESVLKLLL